MMMMMMVVVVVVVVMMTMVTICYSNLLGTILSATYATPQTIRQFYMQQPNILNYHFIQFIAFLMMGPKHLGAVGLYYCNSNTNVCIGSLKL
jgi:hypothetical protein